MNNVPNLTPFESFMEASRLTHLNASQFAFEASGWSGAGTSVSVFDQAAAEIALPAVDDKLQDLLASRVSSRQFNADPIPTRALAEVLAAAGSGSDGRPVVPSAGGLDPLGIYAIVRSGEGELDRQSLRYHHGEHRVAIVGPAPDEEACRRLFSLDSDETPPLLLVFAVDPTPTLEKYGDRGGRFLLQQVGHAMQNVGLRLAESQRRRRGARLHGYILGGVLDEVADVLGFGHTRARVIAAYAVGTGRASQPPG